MDCVTRQNDTYRHNTKRLIELCCENEEAEELSREERKLRGLTSTVFAYGELEPEGVIEIIQDIREQFEGLPWRGGVLYDLGSGSGKALFAALCAHPFERCVGIELLQTLHEQALQTTSSLKEDALFSERFSKVCIDLRLGDLLQLDWSDASVIIIHATVFDNDMMASIQLKAENMPSGTYFIVVSKELRTGVVTGIETLSQYRVQASWGNATVSLQRKAF